MSDLIVHYALCIAKIEHRAVLQSFVRLPTSKCKTFNRSIFPRLCIMHCIQSYALMTYAKQFHTRLRVIPYRLSANCGLIKTFHRLIFPKLCIMHYELWIKLFKHWFFYDKKEQNRSILKERLRTIIKRKNLMYRGYSITFFILRCQAFFEQK